jgi:hypothetical protein
MVQNTALASDTGSSSLCLLRYRNRTYSIMA